MPFTFLMLPPQTETTRDWGKRLAATLPTVRVVIAETTQNAEQEIAQAEAAYGTLSPDLLAKATRLRWLQSPQAAPPAGYYHRQLIDHPVIVSNMREIYNDHIGAHIMAFVLAFARDFQTYIPQQLRREWRPRRLDTGIVHLPESTALIVGVGGIGAEAARLAAAFGMRVLATDARRTDPPPGVAELHPPEALDTLLPRADFVIRPPHPGDGRFHAPRPLPSHEANCLLHQHRPWQDNQTGRPRRRPARRRNRRGRVGCI